MRRPRTLSILRSSSIYVGSEIVVGGRHLEDGGVGKRVPVRLRKESWETVMTDNVRSARLRIAQLASFVLAVVLLLLWSTAAYAQSREDQYGSPTDPVDHVNRVSGTLGVLPETGGPLILLVGVALGVGGAGRARGGRWGGRR